MLGGPSNARWCLSISGKCARVCLASFTSCPWPRCWGQSQVVLFSARWPFYGATSLRRPSEPFCRPRVIKMKSPERQKSKKNTSNIARSIQFVLYREFTESFKEDMCSIHSSLLWFKRKWQHFVTQTGQSAWRSKFHAPDKSIVMQPPPLQHVSQLDSSEWR